MINFKKISYKNLLSVGEFPVEINFQSTGTTLITGANGNGKCVRKNTRINVKISDDAICQEFQNFINKKNEDTMD